MQERKSLDGGRVWVGWAGGGGASLTRQVSWCGEKEGECQKSSAARIGRLAFNVVIISMMGGGGGGRGRLRAARGGAPLRPVRGRPETPQVKDKVYRLKLTMQVPSKLCN